MRIIKKEDAELFNNSPVCDVVEYSFGDCDLDLGVSTIKGRYPDKGFSLNEKSKMIVYVVEGKGKLYLEDDMIYFEVGDTILINAGEKYYWDSDYCVLSIVSNPAWSALQYKQI